MATTPQRGWPYPDEFENPYWESFVTFAEAVDSDVNALYAAPPTIPYSIINAQGDLIVGIAPNTAIRKAKGAPSSVLTSITGGTGLEWVYPPILNVRDFGVVGDGVTDDTAALQALVGNFSSAAGYGVGGIMYFPPGRYRLTAPLVIDRQITLAGAGPMSELRQATLSANIITITAISNVPTLGPNPSTSREVTIRDLALSYGTNTTQQVATAGACIYSDPGGPADSTGTMTYGNRFLNLDLWGGWDGIHFERGAYFTIDNCHISAMQRYGVYIRNVTSPHSGDSQISNCLFWDYSFAEQTLAHVILRSSGGLRMTNCKVLWGQYALLVDVEAATGTLNVSNCSLGGTKGGIKLWGSGGGFTGATISGCQFDAEWSTPITYIEILGALQEVLITGCNFILAQDNTTAIKLGAGPIGVTIAANQFVGYLGANLTAIDVGAGVQQMTVIGNGYAGTFARRFVNASTTTDVHYHDGAAAYALASGDATTIVNSAGGTFDKTCTIGADLLNVIGTRVHVHMAGRYSTKASGPGALILAVLVGGSYYQLAEFAALTLGAVNLGWSYDGYLTVRTLGATATVQDSGGHAALVNTGSVAINTNATMTLNLTGAITLVGAVNFSIPDPATSITLTTMVVSVLPASGGTF